MTYYSEHKEERKAYAKEYRVRRNAIRTKYRNTEEGKEKRRYETKRYRERNKIQKLSKKYNVSSESIKKLLDITDCEICGSPANHIDHNHETGEVRGRLCTNCNLGIGLLRDDIVILTNAISYLNKKPVSYV